jgi:hypothetical protein
VLAHVLLQVVVDQLEDQIELLLGGDIEHLAEAGWMDGYWTMLGWGCNYLRIDISLIAVEGTPSSSFSNLIFLTAT